MNILKLKGASALAETEVDVYESGTQEGCLTLEAVGWEGASVYVDLKAPDVERLRDFLDAWIKQKAPSMGKE